MCTPLSELFHFCEMCESVACLLILSLVVCCQLCFVFTSPASSCDYCQLFLLLASLPPVFIISVYSCPLSSSSALFWLLFRSDFTFLLLCTAKIPATFHMTNPKHTTVSPRPHTLRTSGFYCNPANRDQPEVHV